MKDILEEIIAYKRLEVEQRKQFIKEQVLVNSIDFSSPIPSLRNSLLSGSGIIAEFKRKSPSKGWINQGAKPEDVALRYEKAGASAISILTDTHFFGGYDEHVQQARAAGVTLPILYKNFVIDEYQLLQARYCGASAVLLIAACLSKEECKNLIKKAHGIGLEVLLELHDTNEIDYLSLDPDVCGINNRHLGTFHTDVAHSISIVTELPAEMVKVSESGIEGLETIYQLYSNGYNGCLIGETLMRQAPSEAMLSDWVKELKRHKVNNYGNIK